MIDTCPTADAVLPSQPGREGMGEGMTDIVRGEAPLPGSAGKGPGVRPAPPEAVALLAQRVDGLAALVMAQNAVLEKISRHLEEQRVTRTQETAIKRAIQARAKEIALREGLKGRYDPNAGEYLDPEKRLGAAIRKTLRELTGARAAGDIRACVYDSAMKHIMEWDYPGAIRRIRKETSA